MKAKVISNNCGHQVAWWLGELPKCGDIIMARNFERLDGTHPNSGDIVFEVCPECNMRVNLGEISIVAGNEND